MSKTEIISHVRTFQNEVGNETYEIQTNNDHSEGVARRAEAFAKEFGFTDLGKILGKLHDKGKEQLEWQNYIKKESGFDKTAQYHDHVRHAYVGALMAKELYPQIYPLLSYPILGHHAGLADFVDFESEMKKKIPSDVLREEKEDFQFPIEKIKNFDKKGFHHLIRMLYSCLVDADFLDTEEFMNGKNSSLRGNHEELINLLPRLKNKLTRFKQDSELNKIRTDVQACCKKMAEAKPGFYSLTVPTGGGKTLASILWAMMHAVKHGKKRIIIVIPYTSIIVQTAQVLRDIFGEENVLEHHSSMDIKENDSENNRYDEKELRRKLATENWDYPIIVTTNVQLFESMLSNKPSTCRKLHNICNSVVILDEAQMLPLEFLQPIIDSLKVYQKCFGVSVLFTTASMPALEGDYPKFSDRKYLHGIEKIHEIIPDDMNLTRRLERVDLHFEDSERLSYDEIAEQITHHDRVLCIVNTRRDAQEIYSRLPKEGITLHLSRMMCPKHVNKVINYIKVALKDTSNQIIRVVSTQLVEAGVDIDFPVVYRQETGLDSILQSAGRCNREGLLKGKGQVYVFALDKPLPKGFINWANESRKNVLDVTEWFGKEAIQKYFEQLYSRTRKFDVFDVEGYLYEPSELMFKTEAESFRLIKDNSISVVVNYEDSLSLVEELRENGFSYQLMKRLSQYSVNIYEKDFKELKKMGLIDEVLTGLYVVLDSSQYDKYMGLTVDNHWLNEIFIC